MIKRTMCLLLIIVISVIYITSCKSYEETNHKTKATFYTIENLWTMTYSSIYEYNNQCKNKDNKIKIVTFENDEALSNRLSTELMTGGGPDLIALSTLTVAGMSPEKLIEEGVFENINDLIKFDTSKEKLNLSDYNKNALECGVIDGKRLFIPFYYVPDVLVTTQQIYKKYGNINNPHLNYQDIFNISKKLDKENSDTSLYSISDDCKNLLYDLIDENIDFANKSFSFDDKFKETVSKIKEVAKSSKDNCKKHLIDISSCYSPYFLYSKFAKIENEGETPLILNKPSANGNSYSATIDDVFFIRKNSEHKQALIDFLKYGLSKEYQNEITGAEIKKYDIGNEKYSGIYFPVNNNSYKTLMKNAERLKYLGNTRNISKESSDMLNNYLSKITDYHLNSFEYYNANVIGKLIEDYLDDKISTDKFIKGLSSKTKIYMEE